ncbi:hypothetical protein V1477_009335 [Vespula maculifrons]|uniref:Uncharacterized protein n=1 Tax=Vespula maculifrons TaxID=7453 RepID=A0ABD2C9H9_VESMC
MNPRGTHAPQSITRSFNNLYDFYRCRMKRGGGDGLPLGGDIRRPPLTVGPWVQSCHEFPPYAYESAWYGRSTSKREGLIMKRSGGDGLPLVKRYKAADFGNGPVLSRISTSPNLSPRSTHAPENRVVWWGYFGTREVIKGDGLCQGVQSCHEFQRVHISILVVHTPRKLDDRGTDQRGTFTRKLKEPLCMEGMSPCFRTRMLGKTLTRVTAGTRLGVRDREN